ncbi:MAG: O-antigen ligase family protein [Candidatus Hydrogenedentes bacterium]|nr:O-antigen ligase family protein [Candidatus Hydrogenedentota bacterium]
MSAVAGGEAKRVSSLPWIPILIAAAAICIGAGILAGGAYALAGLGGLIVFYVIARNPTFGLYLTTALLLLSGSSGILGISSVGVPVTVAKICGLMTFVAWASGAVVRRKRFLLSGPLVFLLLFFAWVFFGTMRSTFRDEQLPEYFRLGTLVVFFVMTVHLLDSWEKAHRYVVVIASCGIVMAAFAVYQYFSPSEYLAGESGIADIGAGTEGAFVDVDSLEGGPAIRVSGRAGHSNWLAMILLLLFPLNVYWYNTAQHWQTRWLAVCATVIELLALVFTFTRTGLIVGVTILTAVTLLRQVRITPQRVSAAALALVIAWFILPDAYKERVLMFHQYTGSESVNYRVQLQQAAVEMTAENPVLGTGIGGFGLRLLDRGSEVSDILRWLVDRLNWNPVFYGTHNMYLQLSSETGLVGLGLMLVFFALLVRGIRNARRNYMETGDTRAAALAAAVEVSLMSFLLCAVFLHALQQKIWWMIAALATVIPGFTNSSPARVERDA